MLSTKSKNQGWEAYSGVLVDTHHDVISRLFGTFGRVYIGHRETSLGSHVETDRHQLYYNAQGMYNLHLKYFN